MKTQYLFLSINLKIIPGNVENTKITFYKNTKYHLNINCKKTTKRTFIHRKKQHYLKFTKDLCIFR